MDLGLDLQRNVSLALLARYENKVVWNLNTLCNYRCTYCFFPPEVLAREHDAVGRYSVDHISQSFDDTGREWLILISGGEPFLYKEFVPLASKITQNHHIQLTSNLSRPSVYAFGEQVDPKRVMIISASLHIADREQRGQKAVQDFIDKVLFLQSRGFLILVNYVTFPPLFDRIRDDFATLSAAGVEHLTTLTFRGEFEGRTYPQAYTDEQLALIEELAVDKGLERAVSLGLRYEGRICDAGSHYFQMGPDGHLNRCCSILEDRGNLFEGTARFDDQPTPCTIELCQDACLGLESVRAAEARAGTSPTPLDNVNLIRMAEEPARHG